MPASNSDAGIDEKPFWWRPGGSAAVYAHAAWSTVG